MDDGLSALYRDVLYHCMMFRGDRRCLGERFVVLSKITIYFLCDTLLSVLCDMLWVFRIYCAKSDY